MVTITCSSCHKPLSIDESKLPMKEVGFPCPSCKARLTVDRRTLVSSDAPPAAASAQVSQQSQHGQDVADDHQYGDKALIVGVDSPVVRQAARSLALQPIHFPTPQACRDFFLQEYPAVVFLNPSQLTPPPLDEMQAITSVSPADRRKGFYVLLADNLRTLDGNAAFLYGVNLVVANKDLGSIAQIYRDAHNYHQKLYASMLAHERH